MLVGGGVGGWMVTRGTGGMGEVFGIVRGMMRAGGIERATEETGGAR